jgi:hypothetical protein
MEDWAAQEIRVQEGLVVPAASFIIQEPITDYVSTTTDPAPGNREEGPPEVRIRHGPGAPSGRRPAPSPYPSASPSRTQNPEKAPAPAKTYPALTSPWRRSPCPYKPAEPHYALKKNVKDRHAEKNVMFFVPVPACPWEHFLTKCMTTWAERLPASSSIPAKPGHYRAEKNVIR